MSAKNIHLAPIDNKTAREFIKRNHYSGKAVNTSQLHIGVYPYRGGTLEGVMQYGPPLDKSKVIGLVADTPWSGMLELNRMAFTSRLPRNSESRALAVAARLLKKHAPHVQWVLSFSDAAQCGDGTIYRAAGFVLTGIKENEGLIRLPSGEVIHVIALAVGATRPRAELDGKSYFDVTGGKYTPTKYVEYTGAEFVKGYQMRYIQFLHPTARERLTVPEIPFSEIPAEVRMYRGERVTI